MKEDNKKFFSDEIFYERITTAMELRGLTIDGLFKIICKDVGYEITKNNLNLYLHRIPNVNFLIALSRALGVSTDYLLGSKENKIKDNKSAFDFKYETQRYNKYKTETGSYYFYFYPTVNSFSEKINQGFLSIEQDNESKSYSAKLIITTDENAQKEYSGDLVLSSKYNVGYMTLAEPSIGEIAHLAFCDPIINTNVVNVEIILGAMLTISSGDNKRVPVMSRFILSRNKIAPEKYNILKANLLLNSKFIPISTDEIESAVGSLALHETTKEELIRQLKAAFKPKEICILEESYILNTLSKEIKLQLTEINDLLNILRLNSIESANNKLNVSAETRLYNAIKNQESQT